MANPKSVQLTFPKELITTQRVGRGAFRVTIDKGEVQKLSRRFQAYFNVFVRAANLVNPEFGAYMPYSVYLELGGKAAPRPHIVPAIEGNANYIVTQIGRRAANVALALATGSANTAVQARNLLAMEWEDVLNGKPRQDAIQAAPVKWGFHRSTIRGYGMKRKDSEIEAQQERLSAQRARLEAGERSRSTASIRGHLRKFGGR